MKREFKEFDGEKYIFDVPENEKDAICLELRKIRTYWTEKSEEERIVDYIIELLDRNTKQVRKEVCEEIKNWCNKNFNWVGDGTGYDGQDYYEMIGSNNTINTLREFLDQIQGETK